jgi:tetratricopeptide (TPR) repeat protein
MFPLTTSRRFSWSRKSSWKTQFKNWSLKFSGNLEKSIRNWLQLLERESSRPQLQIVKNLIDHEVYQEARDYLEKFIGVDKAQDAELYYLMVRCFMAQGLIQEALEGIFKALEMEPYNAAYLELLADIQLEQGDWQEAIEVLSKAIRTNPQNTELLFRLGTIYTHHGEHLEALRCYQGCCELKPRRAKYWEMKAESHLQLKQIVQAAASFDRALRYGVDPDLVVRLAYCYVQLNELKKGIHYYKMVLKYEPDHYDALCNLAAVYQNMGRSLDALNFQEKAYSLCKNDPILLNNLAYTLVQLGRSRKATEYYQEALKLTQENPLILYNLAVCHAQKGNWEAGIETLERLLRIDTEHSEGWALLGNIYEQRSEYEQAIDCFNRALKLA